jgi:hypothetical protein
LQDLEDKCFFCTARDFAEVGIAEYGHTKCDPCKECLVSTDARQSFWHRFKAEEFQWSNGETIYSLSRCFEVAGDVPANNGNGLTWLKRIEDRIGAFEDCLGQLRDPKSTDDWEGTRTQCAAVCTKI